ncbi:MAG: hypothetical protein HJJLKODD_01063 [Phycisphaerae bacterium]|nr:hypothetical protein [Phycisphaerae bacterium]
MSPTEALFWFLYVFGTLGALFNPIYGALLYILVYNLNPETQWWGGHVVMMGLRTSFVPAIATIIGLVINYKPLEYFQRQFPLMFKLMLIYILYSFLASTTENDPLGNPVSQFLLDKMLRIAIFVFIIVRVVRKVTHYAWLLWAWMAGTIYIGYQAWSGVGIEVNGRLTGGLGGPDFAESSGLAAHLVAMIALAGYLFYSSISKRGKFFALLAAAFAVNTIIMTRTRNAFPGIIVLILFGLLRLPRGVRLKCTVGIAVGIFFSIQLTDEGWWKRMETLKDPQADPSIASRFDYWNAAFAMAGDHTFGVGAGQFRFNIQSYLPGLEVGRSAHSTYMECLAELGYPGLILFLMIIGATFWQMERARSVGKSWSSNVNWAPEIAAEQRKLLLIATANEVALAGFLMSAAFTTRSWTEGMWLLLGQSCCLYNLAMDLHGRLTTLWAAYEVRLRPSTPMGAVPALG